jgi:hypothetical protein
MIQARLSNVNWADNRLCDLELQSCFFPIEEADESKVRSQKTMSQHRSFSAFKIMGLSFLMLGIEYCHVHCMLRRSPLIR